jgi:hypothetical protein
MNEDPPYDEDVELGSDILDDGLRFSKDLYNDAPLLKDDGGDSQFVQFAQYELSNAGLFDPDSDYGGMAGRSVMELVRVFSKQGHSGFSASMVSTIFYDLTKWKPLTPLTNNPREWNEVGYGMWQSSRSPSSFSDDGGKTYYNLDDEPRVTYTSEVTNEAV